MLLWCLLTINNLTKAEPSHDAIGLKQSDCHETVLQALEPTKPKFGRSKGSKKNKDSRERGQND